MKKCSREQIKKHRLFGKNLVLHKEYSRKGSTYHIATEEAVATVFGVASLIVATGKELNGYKDSILWIVYDGEEYGTGDYYLKSDDHGIVCKWKG